MRVKKLQFTRRGVVIWEISSPNSPTSRKRSTLDVVHKLKKWKQTPVENNKAVVVFKSDHDSDDTDTWMGGSFHVSPWRDIFVKSTFKETSNHEVNENLSNTNVNINFDLQ